MDASLYPAGSCEELRYRLQSTPVGSIHLAHGAEFIPLDESRECLESIALDGTAILGQL